MTITSLRMISYLAIVLMFTSCNPPVPSDQKPIYPATRQSKIDNPTAAYADMLRRRVNRVGEVHYAGIKADSEALVDFHAYMDERFALVQQAPAKERLAYWINVYNASVLQLVIAHYPIYSILDIGIEDSAPGRRNYDSLNRSHPEHPYDLRFIELGKERYSLNAIKDSIIRGEFNEPRAILALCDGTTSSPRLRRQLYMSDTLEQQLDDACREFLNRPTKNNLNPNDPKLSPIFQWYAADFGGNDTEIIAWINAFIPVNVSPDAKIQYAHYKWKLNGY